MRKWKWLIVLVLLAGVLFGFAWAYSKYTRLMAHTRVALHVLRELQSLADEGAVGLASWDAKRLISLQDDLGRLEESFLDIKAEVGFLLPLCPHLSWVPRLGDDIAAAPSLLDMAIELSAAGWWAISGAEPLVGLLLDQQKPDIDAVIGPALARLVSGRSYFLEAREALRRVTVARSRFRSADLTPSLARLIERLDKYLPLLQAGMESALLMPDLLGVDGPRTFLLLAQNNHELRPTGGFISGVGLLRVEQGRVLSIDLEDSYAVDNYGAKAYPSPPEPLARYMWAGILLLRDANWSPDFPTSAEVIASLYQLGRESPPIDGVIAADLTAVQLLVDAVSPLKLEGYKETITGGSVLPLLQQYWSAPVGAGTITEQKSSDWWRHRKDVMGDLLGAVLSKIKAEPRAIDAPRLLRAIMACLDGKHLLMYLHQKESAEVLARNRWDGALRAGDGDYLMVVDANLGFNKVDPNIERRIEYKVYLEQSPPRGEVSITYVNKSRERRELCRHEDLYGLTEYKARSYEELMEGCYWNYVRLYVPGGSRLRQVTGSTEAVDVAQEHGKVAFGTFLGVAPGESRELRFLYDLPSEIAGLARKGYRLTVQKQAGAVAVPIHIQASLPPAAVVQSISPGARISGGQIVGYEALLASDQFFQISLAAQPKAWITVSLSVAGLFFLGCGLFLRLRR